MSGLFYFVFTFITYSFLGWCLEEVFSYFVLGYFKKDGFLSIPFKPMYGFAAGILVYVYEVLNFSKISMIVFFAVVPTIVEYISGYLLKRFFGKTYWDYNDIKFNFQGLICLKFSLAWIGLSAFMIFMIQPVVNSIYISFESGIIYVSILLLINLLLDFIEVVIENSYKEVS